MNVNGTKKCTCRSGKKYAKCCALKKPRECRIMFKVPKKTTVDGVILGACGKIILTSQGKPVELSDAAVEISYRRDKKRKVVFRATTDIKEPSIDPNLPLSQYHGIYAVDTNTKIIRGIRISVTCVLALQRERTELGLNTISIPMAAIELHNVIGDPERAAWLLVCERLLDNPSFTDNLQIAMIVDSSLGCLDDINKRHMPVFKEKFLPDGFTLFYASSDSTKDSIGNSMIAKCDKHASHILREIENNFHERNLHKADLKDCWSHIRNWVWAAQQK